MRRPGRADHIVLLDEITLDLATAWIIERTRTWPRTANPYLFLSLRSAVVDAAPMVSTTAVDRPFRQAGLQASRLREDRILDEAKETADPALLMRLFGLSTATAVRYVAVAHPAEFSPDPVAP